MKFEIGLDEEARAKISGLLSKLLADTYALYVKTQNLHWNIHGPEFYSLHLLTEKQYLELAENIDEIAERIRALGFYVEASMESFLKLSSIAEEHAVNPKHTYLEHLIQSHEVVIRDCRNLGNAADKHHDHGTVDMIGKLLRFHEKASWMLRSQI